MKLKHVTSAQVSARREWYHQGQTKEEGSTQDAAEFPRPQQCHSHGVWVLWTDAAHALALWLSSTTSHPLHLFLSLLVAVPAQTLSRWPRPAPTTHEIVSAAPAQTLLFLRLQQMHPSMNPSTTRKTREGAEPVPGWSPSTMPEVGWLHSCSSQWFPLEAMRRTESSCGAEQLWWSIFPSQLWTSGWCPRTRSIPSWTEDVATVIHLAVAAQSDCHFHSYHNSSRGVFQSPSCVGCLHSETTCKLVGSWTSLRKPQLCTKVSLRVFPGSAPFHLNTHSPADQRLKTPLNQDRTQWTRGCPHISF